MTGNAPAGWYESSVRFGELRYWDGAEWTTAFAMNGTTRQFRAAGEPPPVPPIPPPPAPPKSRPSVATIVRLGVLGLCALVLLICGLVYLGTRPTVVHLDQSKLESGLRSWAHDDLDAVGDVEATCPNDPSGEIGGTLRCIVKDDTASIRVVVTIEDEDGSVTWVVG